MLTRDDMQSFLSLQLRLERAIRAQVSEHVILQGHDKIYVPVKRAIVPVRDLIEGTLGLGPIARPREAYRSALADLRSLLAQDAQERALHETLLRTRLLDAALEAKVVSEVTMAPTASHRGMRMDLLVDPADPMPTQVVELKRGRHLLVARRGKAAARLSRQLTKAIKQVDTYGLRLGTEPKIRMSIEQQHGVRVRNPELRLVAGRRLATAQEYTLLSNAESSPRPSKLQLQIYTWDGLVAEIERLID